jgi:hypothetical protein
LRRQNHDIAVEFELEVPQDAVSCEELELIQAHFAGLLRQLLIETDSTEN